MFLQINDVQLYYRVSGTGMPLLLIHGNQEDHRIFDQLTAALSPHYTLYQIDSRNHGLSSQSTEYNYDTMASDIIAFIEELKLKQVHLLGFSDGAIISLLVSQQLPETIQGMALLGINLSPQDFKPDVYAEIEEEYQRDKHPLTKLMLTEPQLRLSDLKPITIPTLVVAGEDDCCSTTFFQHVAQQLPRGELLVVKGHNHSSYIVNEAILAQPLLNFFTHNKK